MVVKKKVLGTRISNFGTPDGAFIVSVVCVFAIKISVFLNLYAIKCPQCSAFTWDLVTFNDLSVTISTIDYCLQFIGYYMGFHQLLTFLIMEKFFTL